MNMNSKFAFITGINGQTGSFLGELLLAKQYIVYGIIRRHSHFSTTNIDHYREKLILHYGDMQDLISLQTVLSKIKSKMNEKGATTLEVYHLAAQSNVKVSFELPVYTTEVNAVGSLNLLEAIKFIFYDCNKNNNNKIRIYNAVTSELYGKVQEIPQSETTPFHPRSPYACSKLFSYYQMINYREAYNMFICNGIAFNHESERRGETFVTRKITIGINKILKGEIEYLELGNLTAKRDWSHAEDISKGMYLMLQQKEAKDYVLGSNENYSVREFVELAFQFVGIKIQWEGSGANEIGKNIQTDKILIKVNPKYYRPTEVDTLLGDSNKARRELNWKPLYSFIDLVKCMVRNDCGEYFIDKSICDNNKNLVQLTRTIIITGGTGLVGSALKMIEHSFKKSDKLIFLSSKHGDLRSEKNVNRIFNQFKPTHVIHLAANVGGLYKNLKNNLKMYHDNMKINQNVLKYCHQYKVKQLISCLSTCIFPDKVKYPITEDDLHCGVPHKSNQGYAFAKRMLHVETAFYNKYYNTNYLCITPTNIFGPFDNFNLENGHVIPSLIHKCYLAKQQKNAFTCFGSGKPLRQFIYSLDVAKIILLLLSLDAKCIKDYNIILTPSATSEISIKYVAQQITMNLDYDKDEIIWDKTKSDGQFKKTASNTKLMELFPNFEFTNFDKAIEYTVKWFINNYPNIRK